MATKSFYQLNPELVVTLKTPDYDARSFSVNLKGLVKCGISVLFAFFLTLLGSILFLRELEKSRKLEDRLLQMEIRSMIASTPVKVVEPPPQRAAASSVVTPSSPTAPTTPAQETQTPPAVAARIQEFESDCQDGICNVQVSLIPSQTGVAQGELLIVLETEIPRIGSGSANSSIRKRFFIHPGNEARDELTDTQVVTLPKKPFRFGRALHTSAEFTIGEVLKPIAVNLYLFDSHNTITHHERKTIHTGESHVE